MNTYFSDWYREANINPEHSWLEPRWKAVELAAQDASATSICELARLYHAREAKDPDFEQQFRLKFQETDNAFQMSGNEFEISLLAGATLMQIMQTYDHDGAIAAALAIVCPTLQGACVKGIVSDIVVRTQEYLSRARVELRSNPPSPSRMIPARFDDETLKPLVDFCTANNHAEVGKQLSILFKQVTPTLKSLTEDLQTLQEYQLLYREESDILWWLTGKFSRDLEIPFRDIAAKAICIVAGKELADMTCILPGPLGVPAILDAVISPALPDNPEVTVSEAVYETDHDWRERLVKSLPPSASLDLSPVLFAVNESLRSGSATAMQSVFKSQFGINAKTMIRSAQLAQQVYDECLFHRAIARLSE